MLTEAVERVADKVGDLPYKHQSKRDTRHQKAFYKPCFVGKSVIDGARREEQQNNEQCEQRHFGNGYQ